jgi:hypothetical protein
VPQNRFARRFGVNGAIPLSPACGFRAPTLAAESGTDSYSINDYETAVFGPPARSGFFSVRAGGYSITRP